MIRKLYLALIAYLLCSSAIAQTTSLRGIYIDHFSNILGNSVKEDSLLHYFQDSSFNYMLLYDLHNLNLQNTSTANSLGSFIKRARDQYGVTYVGAVGENYNSFKNNIAPYNNNRSDDHERFNVFNLEFEFWTASSVNPGGYYCTQYLQAANCSCDTSGGFKFFIEQMHNIDSLATVQQAISETYLGWFNQGQASRIQQNADRILLHAYRTNTSTLFSYSKTRLSYLASNNTPVDVAPIFSAEPNFMGPWLETHSQLDAYDQYISDFNNDNSSWKQYINMLGFQWFVWRYMPKPVPGTFNPVITASSALTICSGDSVVLTATSGNSYQWSSGQTTQSINVSSAASYTCDVTLNGYTQTTPAASVVVKNNPSATISSGTMANSQMPLTANATAGSGSISSYQWMLDNSPIGGATASTFTSVISGNYTVEVVNSYGCNKVSPLQDVQISGSCNTSTPSGLGSSAVTNLSFSLHWLAGQSGDSIIIRYQADTSSSNYQYMNMLNIGQSAVVLGNLQPNTTYGWSVKTMCGSTSGNYSNKAFFTTGVSTGLPDPPPDPGTDPTTDRAINAYPNPVDKKLNVGYSSSCSCIGEITVIDINSRIVHSEKVSIGIGKNIYELNTSEFGNGFYFISLKTDESVMVRKVIVGH